MLCTQRRAPGRDTRPGERRGAAPLRCACRHGARAANVARAARCRRRQAERRSTRTRSSTSSDLSVFYGKALAVSDVSLEIYQNAITALIGPSGCGKSTFLRCLNRMNDLVASARIDGNLLYHGTDLYGAGVDPIEVRRRIGMVFQRPNPFPKSIYDNVAYGLRILGMKDSSTTASRRLCAGRRSGTRSSTG